MTDPEKLAAELRDDAAILRKCGPSYLSIADRLDQAADALLAALADSAAVDWILNDAAYKAPEQFNWLCHHWLGRLLVARSKEHTDAADES